MYTQFANSYKKLIKFKSSHKASIGKKDYLLLGSYQGSIFCDVNPPTKEYIYHPHIKEKSCTPPKQIQHFNNLKKIFGKKTIIKF